MADRPTDAMSPRLLPGIVDSLYVRLQGGGKGFAVASLYLAPATACIAINAR